MTSEYEPTTADSSSSSEAIFEDSGSDGAQDLSDVTATPVALSRSNSSSSVSYIDLSKLLLLSDFDFGLGLDQVGDSTKKRFNDMKKLTKDHISRLKLERPSRSTFLSDSINLTVGKNKELSKAQEVFIHRLSKFDQRINANLQSSATEKLFYALAVFTIAVSGFIIGKYPEWFHIFYTGLFCLLMPIRFYTYFKQSFQYYLADLCYYVNLLLVLFIWWFPASPTLFVSVFSLTMGTLSFAVITWRNSLVLHSIEKTTSSFIHIMPPVTMFVIVHELPESLIKQRFPAVASIESWDFVNGILWTSFYYTIWQVTYHYFITIKRKEKIEKGRVTSFSYLKKKNANKAIGRFVNSLPYNWMQITAFTLIQFGYQILTMIFCPIWFKYKHACGAFMCFIFIWASYNGATYYIDVFGKRLDKEVERLKREILELQEKKGKVEEKDLTDINNDKLNVEKVAEIDKDKVTKVD
ncbi:glycerophosphocholine acyltransferase 1 [[Candida] anglica]|uniref:Glycerophosphocholine acyltransferase 1 n=1 Tax=[Candida] anglica TaxID=148631 RepID=A0ABP0EAU0_9ASCO